MMENGIDIFLVLIFLISLIGGFIWLIGGCLTKDFYSISAGAGLFIGSAILMNVRS